MSETVNDTPVELPINIAPTSPPPAAVDASASKVQIEYDVVLALLQGIEGGKFDYSFANHNVLSTAFNVALNVLKEFKESKGNQ